MTRFSAPHGRAGPGRARLVRLLPILVALLGLVTCRPTRDLAEGPPEAAAPLALRASAFEGHDDKGSTEWSVSIDLSEGRGTFLETLLLEGDREVGLTDGTTRRVRDLAPADSMRLERGLVGLVTGARPLPPKADAAAKPGLETRRVVATIFHLADVLVTVRTARGEVVATTDHPFLKSGVGWVKAGDLVVGDEIVTAQSVSPVRVVSTETSRVPPTPVYNLTIEGTHTYYVGPEALLVHNTCDGDASDPPIVEIPNQLGDDAPNNRKIRKPVLGEDGKWTVNGKPLNTGVPHDFIVDMNGELQITTGGHFHMAGYDSVRYAGQVVFKDGEIVFWSNDSGHFKPPENLASQAGLPLDKFWPISQQKDDLIKAMTEHPEDKHNYKKLAEYLGKGLTSKDVAKMVKKYGLAN
jgi:Pretoxin HINT domain